MAATPGILYVTMQPKPALPESQFHDWYNNEHGPTRLRLDFCTNGFRYRASDLAGESASESRPEWLAFYDITDMAALNQETYLRLRGPPVKTPREAEIMAQIKVDRKLYDFIEGRESAGFKKLEHVESEGRGNVLVAVSCTVKPGAEHVEALHRWYREEHIEMLSKVPGWLRTRRFKTSFIDSTAPIEYLTLHEYAPENGLGGPEFEAATTTPWCKRVMDNVVKDKSRRVYDLYYTFSAAPRHLAPKPVDWTSTDPTAPMRTKITPTSATGTKTGAIQSFITTPDGIHLPYILEGSSDPNAPLLIFDNSILTTYSIWDAFLTCFFSVPANLKYRVVRFNKRGRSSSCGSKPVTVDVLAADIIAILDSLRVKKAAAVIGVSLGGCTTLNVALTYPDRVERFISCDTSSKSPPGNSKAWGERITLAESENATSSSGETVVGQKLAEATTRRWFQAPSYDDTTLAPILEDVKQQVASNSLEGFKKSVEALFEYDLNEEMKSSKVKGMFLVGGGDGVLPGTMKEMAASFGGGKGAYKVVEGAGHLPMVEKPREFADAVSRFLAE